MTTTAPSNYGAVDDSDVLDRSFDVAETYYLKEGNSLSPEERRIKCFSLMVPILAAVLLVSGAAFFLLKDFGHLYPGTERGDPRDYNDHSRSIDEPIAPTSPIALEPRGPKLRPTMPPEPKSSSTTTTTWDVTSDSPMCAENEKCYDLGLTGKCCPTTGGNFLACCN